MLMTGVASLTQIAIEFFEDPNSYGNDLSERVSPRSGANYHFLCTI